MALQQNSSEKKVIKGGPVCSCGPSSLDFATDNALLVYMSYIKEYCKDSYFYLKLISIDADNVLMR